MSATWTPYGRDQMLSCILTPDVYSPPDGFWLVLSLAALVANATVDLVTEPDPASGYARLNVPLGSGNWTPTGSGEFANNAPTPSSMTITTDSGLILGWALADAPDIGLGNIWVVGQLESPLVLNIANSPFTADDLTLGLYD